jgi:multiple sugar transport system substrate-binding protein
MVFGAAMADNLKGPTIAVWSYGGDLFDKDLTRCTLDSPQAVEALQFLTDLVVKYNYNPNPAQLRGTNVQGVFRAGRLGFWAQGNQLAAARSLDADKPAFAWGLAVLPKGPGGRFALEGGTAHALTKGGKQPDAGWELMKFIASSEFLTPYVGDGLGGVAARKSVMTGVLKSTNLPHGYKDVVDYGDTVRQVPPIPRWVEVSSAISKHFGRLWNGDVSVKQVVADLATEVKPLLEPRL